MSKALTSWKEIAAYLGKGVRTVQRWEQRFGLPVRRPAPASHVIIALPDELEAWVKRQQQHAETLRSGPKFLTTSQERAHQAAMMKKLGDGVTRLQSNRQTLDSNMTRLSGYIKGMVQQNGVGKGKPNQRSTGRGAA